MKNSVRQNNSLKNYILSALVLGSFCFAKDPASAHPHVRVEMRSALVIDPAGRVAAIDLDWQFDQFYAAEALEGLDKNKDGLYSQEELAILTRENFISLKDYDYFTSLRFNGKKQPVADPINAVQTYENGLLRLRFRLPLLEPKDPQQGQITMKIYDPDFFVAFNYVEDQTATSLVGTLAKGCALDLAPIPSDEQLFQTRSLLATKDKEWKPETNEDFGAIFAQAASIICTK